MPSSSQRPSGAAGPPHAPLARAARRLRVLSCALDPESPPLRVVVVGAGFVGCLLAGEVLRAAPGRPVSVTVLDEAAGPGSAAPATRGSWAWLNANRKTPDHYRDLNARGMERWRTHHALSGLPVWCGSVFLHDDGMGGAGYPSEAVGPEEVLRRHAYVSPAALEGTPGCRAYPREGLVCPREALEAARGALAAAGGCRVEYGSRVTGVARGGDGRPVAVEREGRAPVPADVVVLAAGAGTAATLARLGGPALPTDPRPGVLALTAPLPRVLDTIVVARDCYLLQRPDGVVAVGGDMSGDAGRDAAAGDPAAAAAELLRRAAAVVPALAGAELGVASLAVRPFPADGLPCVGWVDGPASGLYVCLTHSGITLAPLLAELAAGEVLGGPPSADLEPYRPARLLAGGGAGNRAYDLQSDGLRLGGDGGARP